MAALHAPFPIRSKLPATGTSIFSVMSALAQSHGAVNLGQGFPDYAIDPQLIDLVACVRKRLDRREYPLGRAGGHRDLVAGIVGSTIEALHLGGDSLAQ